MLWVRIGVYHTQFSVAYFLVSTLLSKMFDVGDRDLSVLTSGNWVIKGWVIKWSVKLRTFFTVFYVFFKIQKTWLFSFFEWLTTFSRTLHVLYSSSCTKHYKSSWQWSLSVVSFRNVGDCEWRNVWILICGWQVATKCKTPMIRGCDVDVQFHVNRVCAGRQYCSMYVGRSTFAADPCLEHDEFLVVSYNCLPGTVRAVATLRHMEALAS